MTQWSLVEIRPNGEIPRRLRALGMTGGRSAGPKNCEASAWIMPSPARLTIRPLHSYPAWSAVTERTRAIPDALSGSGNRTPCNPDCIGEIPRRLRWLLVTAEWVDRQNLPGFDFDYLGRWRREIRPSVRLLFLAPCGSSAVQLRATRE